MTTLQDIPSEGVKKGAIKAKGGGDYMPVSPGRPRLEVDVFLLMELREAGYGFKRVARLYCERTGAYISANTVRARLQANIEHNDGGRVQLRT